MEGRIKSGKLVYFDTDKGEIQIDNGFLVTLEFNAEDLKFELSQWANLLARTVDCIVIDDKLINIYPSEEQHPTKHI